MKSFLGRYRIFFYCLLGFFMGVAAATVFWMLLQIETENKKLLLQKTQEEYNVKQIRIAQEKKKQQEQKKDDVFGKLEVDAQSFLVFDLQDGEEIYSRNADKKLGIASLTKVATSDIFLKSVSEEFNSEQAVEVNFTNLLQEGDSQIYSGEKFSSEDAVKFMMVASSNDMASALTNNIGKKNFLQKMNNLAEELELRSTFFFSESGLDINSNVAGSYSSASDIAKLVAYFYQKYPKVSRNFSIAKTNICSDLKCHYVENTNKLLLDEHWDSEATLFSKTGFTSQTGGSLVMVQKIAGKEFLFVVLSSTKEGRFVDMEKLVEATEIYEGA